MSSDRRRPALNPGRRAAAPHARSRGVAKFGHLRSNFFFSFLAKWASEDNGRSSRRVIRAIKIRALEENRKLKEMIAELLRRGLAEDGSAASAGAGRRVTLPLVQTAHAATPEREMTPDRVADLLLDEDSHSVA